MADSINVVVADDHAAFLSGAVAILNAAPDVTVVGQCTDGDSALQMAISLQPNVILLDNRMAGGGIAAAKNIAESCPQVRVAMLTARDDHSDVEKALEAGAQGYILKGVSGSTLIDAVRAVHAGQRYISPGLEAAMLRASAAEAALNKSSLNPGSS